MHQRRCSGLAPHLSLPANQISSESSGVSLLSCPRLPRWQMDHPYGSCFFFFLFFFFTILCRFQGPLPSNTHLKSCKKTPSLPSQCVNPSPDSVCRGFQETKHFLYCWSRCYWPVRKWSFMALTAAWQGCLLCTGVDWSCNLVARYWADIYDNLSAQTGRISARNKRNKSVCWRIRYSALWLGRWTALFGAQLSCVGDMSFFFFFIRVNYT